MGAKFSTGQIEGFRQAYGDRMSAKEVEFLRSIQSFIEDAIREGLGFVLVVKNLKQNIMGLLKHTLPLDAALRFDLDAALAAGDVSGPNADELKPLRQRNGGQMSEKEVEFLRDISGIADYAMRNDLGFALVVSMLGHDVNGIAHYGFSLDAALADCFLPKVSGFAGSHADSVGAPQDSDE
jgi:hypothetical protein